MNIFNLRDEPQRMTDAFNTLNGSLNENSIELIQQRTQQQQPVATRVGGHAFSAQDPSQTNDNSLAASNELVALQSMIDKANLQSDTQESPAKLKPQLAQKEEEPQKRKNSQP